MKFEKFQNGHGDFWCLLYGQHVNFPLFFQTTPCKHPIIILKDTGRDEASAMLEFAYTGEVNVAQDLLPSLLHTARSFRIKGLDKVENPVDAPPPVSIVSKQTADLKKPKY